MARYTTMVRWYCESLNKDENASTNEIILNSLSTIFRDFKDVEFFDENYRQILEYKIISHYYFREIGFETVGLWKNRLNQKLREIMPYYNKLYKSEKLDYNPLETVSMNEVYTRKNKGEADNTSEATKDENYKRNHTFNEYYNDTPQNYLLDENYATSTTHQSNNNDDNTKSSGNSKSNTVAQNEENYDRTRNGTDGRYTYQDLVLKYRDNFINIDMMIIKELETMFMGLML